jgi:hypothetical protein
MGASTVGISRCLPALVAFLLHATPGPLAAQRADDLPPGTRIRVTAPRNSLDPYVGSLVQLSSDSVTLAPEGGVSALTLGLARVRRIEVSEGEKSKLVTGAAIGFGLGATASLLFLAGFCSSSDTICGGDEWLTAFAVIALPPTLVGAGIGLLIRTERWREVELPPTAAAPQPTATRWHLGLSLLF